MRQVSSESPDIFNFIMDLHHACGGKWNTLVAECNITAQELQSFLEYAGTFLCNLGNYYVGLASRRRRSADSNRAKATKSLSRM